MLVNKLGLCGSREVFLLRKIEVKYQSGDSESREFCRVFRFRPNNISFLIENPESKVILLYTSRFNRSDWDINESRFGEEKFKDCTNTNCYVTMDKNLLRNGETKYSFSFHTFNYFYFLDPDSIDSVLFHLGDKFDFSQDNQFRRPHHRWEIKRHGHWFA